MLNSKAAGWLERSKETGYALRSTGFGDADSIVTRWLERSVTDFSYSKSCGLLRILDRAGWFPDPQARISLLLVVDVTISGGIVSSWQQWHMDKFPLNDLNNSRSALKIKLRGW